MSIFRQHTPKRRSITAKVSKYNDHRDDLKKDYKCRCGYCNDVDTWRIVWFEIDHFVPQKYLVNILATDYSNLVYACRSCNNAKRGKWPTENELIHHRDDAGFIDPCDDEYNNQFSRQADGKIVPLTKLGHWMYNALQFYKPQHEIIWNIEQLAKMIDEIERILANSQSDDLSLKLLNSYRGFKQYVEALSQSAH